MGRVIEDLATRRRPSRPIATTATEDKSTNGLVPAQLLQLAATQLLAAEDVASVLSVAVRSASQLLGTHIAFVMLLDDDGKVLKLEASIGHRTPKFTTIVRPVQAFTVIGAGAPVQSSDFLNDNRLDHDPPTDDIVRKEGMRTVLAVPLTADGQKLGALYVGHREPRTFPAAEVDALVTLASYVSFALRQALRDAGLAARLDDATRALRLADAERMLLLRTDMLRQAVMARIRDQDGVSAVAVALAEHLNRPILITDWKLAPTVQAAAPTGTTLRSPAALLNRTESREAVSACSASHAPVAAGRDWRVAPIEAGRDVLGYLWVGPAPDQAEDRLVELVMDRMLPIVALHLFTRGDAERRQRGDFVYELLAERLPDFSVLEARAALFWPHSGEPHRPVVLTIGESGAQWGSRLEAARRFVAAARPNDLTTVYGRHLVLFVSPVTRHHVDTVIGEVRAVLERSHLSVSVVVGGECRNLRQSRDSTLAALRLTDLLAPSGVIWAEGLEALTQLFDSAQRDRLDALCRSALAPLGHRDSLMDAVHAYYEAGGNKANAARRLSVHVNTLRQRLDRAEQLLGGPIDESIRAVPLRLALLVRELMPVAAR